MSDKSEHSDRNFIYNPGEVSVAKLLQLFNLLRNHRKEIKTLKLRSSQKWSYDKTLSDGVNPLIRVIFSPNPSICQHFHSNPKPLCLKNLCGVFSLQQYIKCLFLFTLLSLGGWDTPSYKPSVCVALNSMGFE